MTTNNTAFADSDTVTVTIKYGKSYEETWAVFKGSVRGIRDMIVDYFGVSPEAVTELTTHELVVNMTNVAHGTGNAAAMLGAVVIPASQSTAGAVTSPGGNPWAGLDEGTAQAAPATPDENPYQSVIDQFAKADDVKELQKVWAANQPAFQNPDVAAAYKARGKELSTR